MHTRTSMKTLALVQAASAVVSGTRMCRPVGDTEPLLLVGLGEAKLTKCEMLLHRAARSFERPGHPRLNLVIVAATLAVSPGALCEAGTWPQMTGVQPARHQSPSFSCTGYGAGPWLAVYNICWLFPLITEEIYSHHKKCFLKIENGTKDNKKPPVIQSS